ncbi:hypothetical protein JCM3770_007093 [Rhodotorula araucariae]
MAPIFPELLWAQRSSETDADRNLVFLTINAPELDADYQLTVSGNKLSFKGKTHQVESKGTASTIEHKEYEAELELFDDVEEKKRALTGKSLQLVLLKKKAQQEYWPRLTKDKVRNNRIRSNFDLWRDEDEQEDEADDAADSFGGEGMGGGMPPGMGGMGGPGGAGGMDFASMMGGMGGAGGAGGPGGMDFASMMGGMGGAGGAGGAGGMDFEKMMEQLKASGMGAGGADLGGEGADEGGDSSDEDGPPPLEEA